VTADGNDVCRHFGWQGNLCVAPTYQIDGRPRFSSFFLVFPRFSPFFPLDGNVYAFVTRSP